jgi:hypothetical protein
MRLIFVKAPIAHFCLYSPMPDGPAGTRALITVSDEDGVLRGIDIILTQHDVCCYALVVSLTAISLCDEAQRGGRLGLFSRALDDFEAGLFDAALNLARAAAAPDPSPPPAAGEHSYDALRQRLNRLLAQRPGRA